MALSQKHRVALFEYLVPNLGEEVTEALLAEFPARDGDELVTKEFLRAELADLRAEMHQLIARSNATVIGAVGVMTAIVAIVG